MGKPRADLSGLRFNRWTVTTRAPNTAGTKCRPTGHTAWNCLCDCGTERVVRTPDLLNGSSGSCGCLIRAILAERNQPGPEHPAWKAFPTYESAHFRVVRARGSASAHLCEFCRDSADDWAYDNNDTDAITTTTRGSTLTYSTKIEHYLPLCSHCHLMFDNAFARACREQG